MGWRTRVAKQAVLVRLPFGTALRRFKRRMVGYEPDPSNLNNTIECLDIMRAALAEQGRSFKNAEVLEIGSGWFPTIPILMCVEGAKSVRMSDLNLHMDEVTFQSTLRYLKNRFPDHKALQAINRLEDLPVSYMVPFAAADVPDASLDFIVSRTVLEHIDPDVIVTLHRELLPKLKKDGLVVHVVDHSDHLEHRDKSISKLNFLTWSTGWHRWINALTREGENRLRHHEYPALFQRAGYDLLSGTGTIHEGALKSLEAMKLAEPFATMPKAELAVLTSTYVLSPTQGKTD